MAYLASEKGMTFLGLLAFSHVEDDAEHDTVDDALFVALSTCDSGSKVPFSDPKVPGRINLEWNRSAEQIAVAVLVKEAESWALSTKL